MSHDSISIEHLWELFSAKLKSFFLLRVSDEQVAEDLVQETFLRIHKKIDQLDSQQRLTAWVFQIARHLVIDHYRSKSKEATQSKADLGFSSEADGNMNEVVMGWLPEMIEQLPEKFRDAVQLYEIQGLPQQQIADQLGLSLSGAKSRIQRGREKLKSQLFDCCSFELDRRGNVIAYVPNDKKQCDACDDACA